jgi:glycosyltransferase involved in cell wall biosynthesis
MYRRFDTTASPGDVLVVLGGPWVYPDYAALIDRHRARRGIRVALLVYDLIPLRRPEWFQSGLGPVFVRWFSAILPICDHLFAISQATATDVEAYAQGAGITLRSKVVPIPIGTSLGSAGSESLARRPARLPVPGSYALIVSTIEARKNHLLLFRVWRRLLEEMPPHRVPTLVFAGHIGWMVDDLLRQIANTENLNGKLVIIEDPSDAELVALYADCLFTLFPSYYEGWGLPVTESLAFGKPCFISNRTSLPEAGGGLARCFDPDDLPAAYDMIRSVLEDRKDLMLWEERVKREFRPVPWSATVAALLAELQHPLAGAHHYDAITDGPAD